ncbi:BatA domain-containing protein [Sphingomonas sp.]|uniref:BatA domain-containing protein n=1 Tax=Sphingomonas sp. TaxID=28214 RepID=UPI0035BC4436
MTPVLLLPAALAALAALAIPLVIHLARKTEQRPTDFAALRWLRERPRPRHRPRLDEWPLLLARLLLLALLALWLARPAVFGAADTIPVVAVAPGVDPNGLATNGMRAVWLAPGFPDLATAPPQHVPIASLVRQLDAELPPQVRLRLVVPAVLQGADAERPRLTRAVDWHIVPGAMAPSPAMRATAPAIAVRSASRYIAAAASAWGARDIGAPGRAVGKDATALAWIGPGPMPAAAQAVLDRGGAVLLAATTPVGEGAATPVWRDALGAPLVESIAVPSGRLLRFTRPLVPAAMPQLLEPDFPKRLRVLFTPDPTPPARVAARNYAPTPGAAPYPQPAIDLRAWLAVAIAALFLVERLLATRRKRAVAP